MEPWRQASENLSEKILVTVPREDARERLAQRHLRAGIVETLEQGFERADASDQLSMSSSNSGFVADLVDGDWLLQHSFEPTFTIQNLQDPQWTDLEAAQAALEQ